VERGVGTNEVEWIRKAEIKKKEIPGGGQSMHGNILTCSRL